jgi:hypothetical protein
MTRVRDQPERLKMVLSMSASQALVERMNPLTIGSAHSHAAGTSLAMTRSYEREEREKAMKPQSNVWDLSNAAECEVATATEMARRGREGTGQFVKGVSEETRLDQSTNSIKVWNHMVDCEARNALQVILSGSEILLDKGCRISPSDQRAILERILASAHHLNCMIATLTTPDEQIGEILVESVDAEEVHAAGSKAL